MLGNSATPATTTCSTGTGPHSALVGDAPQWHSLHRAPRVVGLFLTWRDDRVDDAVDEHLLGRIADVCGARGATPRLQGALQRRPRAVPREHCVLIPADADLHTYLGLCDVLITDYSSVALDFLVLARPTVYYVPDLDRYAATRGFWIHPLSLPGVVTRDERSLVAALEHELRAGAARRPSAADREFLANLWGEDPSHAAAGIAALLDTLAESRSTS